MSGSTSLRDIRVAPASCALLGFVLVLGTIFGQVGSAAPDTTSVSSPMAGMKMPGMPMGAGAAGADAAGSDMAGMDMSGGVASKTAPMDMTQPGMAARMPGGFHSICTTPRSCLVVFDKQASGAASVLGLKTSLTRLTATTAHLQIDGHAVVLKGKKAVRIHGLSLQIVRIDATEVAIRVIKSK